LDEDCCADAAEVDVHDVPRSLGRVELHCVADVDSEEAFLEQFHIVLGSSGALGGYLGRDVVFAYRSHWGLGVTVDTLPAQGSILRARGQTTQVRGQIAEKLSNRPRARHCAASSDYASVSPKNSQIADGSRQVATRE